MTQDEIERLTNESADLRRERTVLIEVVRAARGVLAGTFSPWTREDRIRTLRRAVDRFEEYRAGRAIGGTDGSG